MGRPALQEEDKRIIQVNIRLTKEENEIVCTYAEASAMTPANWIRQKAFTGRFPAIKLSPVNAALYRELHKIGVNLNQAVRQVHGGKLSPAYLTVLTALMKTQKDILNCLLK
ncbi:plasmid mobilization relaxosome protein MobC [Mucilaginibacter sp. S1162]|uniref:Plasmid mobilization relaxosome protein MobC n=1 Tax=Mucilaginibacter humi TaxID=2732510 RepID=A0ABX1W6U5_9SPHI|nr:plasmid mobilization relaxosome protein MobC [Mucilaginibacter humi]NNU33922.1 plasmid mobilization relaxosome protein MobC [Mucilaginibacter humi]